MTVITTVASLRSPRCCICHNHTKLCNSSRNVFEMIWHCDACNTNYNYQTGTEIIDKSVTVGKVTYAKYVKG